MKASAFAALASLLLMATLASAATNSNGAANNGAAIAVPGSADQDPSQVLEIPQPGAQDSDQLPSAQEQSPEVPADQGSQGDLPAFAGIDEYMNQEAEAEAAGGLPPMALGGPLYSFYYPWQFYNPPWLLYQPVRVYVPNPRPGPPPVFGGRFHPHMMAHGGHR